MLVGVCNLTTLVDHSQYSLETLCNCPLLAIDSIEMFEKLNLFTQSSEGLQQRDKQPTEQRMNRTRAMVKQRTQTLIVES